MEDLITLSVFGKDLGAHGGWQLVDWCMSRGAEEFNVFGILAEGSSRAPFEAFDRLADPFRRSAAPRRQLGAPVREELVRPTELWSLTKETMEALHVAFPRGVFEYDPRPGAWFEDLTVYRQGELMLGVITHESEGVLRVSPAEQLQLDQAGISYRLQGEWVGY